MTVLGSIDQNGLREATDARKEAAIRFCQECNNILYPKEDQAEKRLLLACRNCNYKELTYTNCIYNNRMRHIEDELAQINTDVINDPTMPRMFFAHNCPKCSQSEIVFFQSRSTRPDATMRLYYVCANRQCLHIWSE